LPAKAAVLNAVRECAIVLKAIERGERRQILEILLLMID
jgi:hypothetical protein